MTNRHSNLRTRIRGDFLIETSRDDPGVSYAVDENWKYASMAFAHVLCDESDNILTYIVMIKETVTVTETRFLVSFDTYSEVLEIAEEFEDSPSSLGCFL